MAGDKPKFVQINRG